MMKRWFLPLVAVTLLGCSANNCPMDNFVSCNYFFYDSEGTAIKYGDELTVLTLLPGEHIVYTYRKLGYPTITKNERDQVLLDQGYTENVSSQRNDTVLVNKVVDKTMVQVPMSYFHNNDTILFHYASISNNDTIIIEHDSYPHVENPECGTYRYHTLKSVRSTEYGIDHLEISNPKVNYEGNENIKVYFNGVAK